MNRVFSIYTDKGNGHLPLEIIIPGLKNSVLNIRYADLLICLNNENHITNMSAFLAMTSISGEFLEQVKNNNMTEATYVVLPKDFLKKKDGFIHRMGLTESSKIEDTSWQYRCFVDNKSPKRNVNEMYGLYDDTWELPNVKMYGSLLHQDVANRMYYYMSSVGVSSINSIINITSCKNVHTGKGDIRESE